MRLDAASNLLHHVEVEFAGTGFAGGEKPLQSIYDFELQRWWCGEYPSLHDSFLFCSQLVHDRAEQQQQQLCRRRCAHQAPADSRPLALLGLTTLVWDVPKDGSAERRPDAGGNLAAVPLTRPLEDESIEGFRVGESGVCLPPPSPPVVERRCMPLEDPIIEDCRTTRKGTVLAARQWKTQGKGSVLAAKAVEDARQRQCLSCEGSENARQRQCLRHKCSGNARRRQCLRHKCSGNARRRQCRLPYLGRDDVAGAVEHVGCVRPGTEGRDGRRRPDRLAEAVDQILGEHG